MSFEQFVRQFRFRKGLAWYVGVERECLIANRQGKIVPEAPRVLASIPEAFCGADVRDVNGGEFGYELSACQLESRVGPCLLEQIPYVLRAREREQRDMLACLGLQPIHQEVGPADMPLDVYPDPSGRYQAITADMPRETLLAACRVIGTHVHIGMPGAATTLVTYNHVIRHVDELCELGDGSGGARLAMYRQMAPECEPRPYSSWREYYEAACARRFADDPRKCWDLIRISVHGTLEFRMFGATAETDRVAAWARRCHELCTQAAMVYA